MNRLRVVLDTNIVVSAALCPGGLEARVVELVAERKLLLYASAEILGEYQEVLARPRFSKLDSELLARLLALLADRARLVTPQTRLSISPDESDNRFLECAGVANADYLVTGNKRHFPQRWKSTRILNAREMINISSDQ